VLFRSKSGVNLLNGGGTLFDAGNERWKGPGGQSLWGTEAIAHHAYDAQNNGAATLMIKTLYWDANGWPYKDGGGSSSSSSSSSSSGGSGGCD
jgi:arabinan endo-1,5-alpha-L-arabinosidase